MWAQSAVSQDKKTLRVFGLLIHNPNVRLPDILH